MVSHTYDITRCGDQKMGFWFNYDFLGAPDILVCGDSIPAKLGCSAAGRNCNLRLTCITESWNFVFLAEGRQRRSARSSALAIGQSRLIPLRVEQCRLGGVCVLLETFHFRQSEGAIPYIFFASSEFVAVRLFHACHLSWQVLSVVFFFAVWNTKIYVFGREETWADGLKCSDIIHNGVIVVWRTNEQFLLGRALFWWKCSIFEEGKNHQPGINLTCPCKDWVRFQNCRLSEEVSGLPNHTLKFSNSLLYQNW